MTSERPISKQNVNQALNCLMRVCHAMAAVNGVPSPGARRRLLLFVELKLVSMDWLITVEVVAVTRFSSPWCWCIKCRTRRATPLVLPNSNSNAVKYEANKSKHLIRYYLVTIAIFFTHVHTFWPNLPAEKIMKRTKMFQTYWMSQQVVGTPCISSVREIFHLSNGHDKEVDNCWYFSGAYS